MLSPWLDRLTPRATLRTRIFTATCVWGAVGCCLVTRGTLLLGQTSWLMGGSIILASATAGILKSRAVFDGVAKEIVARLQRKPGPACLGGFFSVRNWGLVFCMMLLGGIVKRLPMPDEIKSGIYILVGSGLFYSCRILWHAWRSMLSEKYPDAAQSLRAIALNEDEGSTKAVN